MSTIKDMLPRIALISCGCFSPPTPMHFRMFEIARNYFKTQGTHEVIGGIVSPTHDSYEKEGLVAGTHRFAMLKLALQSSTWIKPSDWEIQQPEWSRTISVLQYHQNYMNNYINSLESDINGTLPGWMPPGFRERQDGVQLKLLCGADLLESFAVPGLWADKDIEDILCNHGLVVISRYGSNPEKFILESDMLKKYQLITNCVPNEVSSTIIRSLISSGQSLKYLLDDRVIDYIQMQGLFNCQTPTTIIEDEQMNNQRIVLIACGSFSPPTPMHLSMIEIARNYFKTQGTHEVIGGIVSPTHDSYEKEGLVAGTHRFAMLKLALQSSTWIKPSDWEIQQSKWSRTISVLQYHQNYMNNYINSLESDINGTLPGWMPPGLRERQDGVQLKLLCGADLLESFAVPGLWADKDIEDIVGNHGLVVISRYGSNPEKFILESDMLKKYQKHITLITNWVPNEVSSTIIRSLISRDQSVKYLLDDRVIDYIQMQGLFNCKTPTTIIEDEQMNNQRIVLIACGSFSPPTPMHLSMIEIARNYFKTQGTHEVIGGIVSPTHDSYEKEGLVAGTHRFAMLKLALQSSTWIKPSDWEIQQSKWSRTISVLQYHQNYMNNYINSLESDINGTLPGWMPPGLRERQDGVQLKLLCGADLLESFAVPGLWADKDIEDIVGNHGLVVISRYGSNPEKFILESDMLKKYQKHITLITNWVPNEVSSTIIRSLISRDQSVKYLLDDRVIDYIQMQGLFNCKTSSVNNSPSDDEDDADEPVQAVHMDQSDYSIKNFLNSFNLDNRKPSSMNVFCCGGNENITAAKKLLPRRNGPGQVVQVVTSEKGTKVVTEIQRVGSGWDESDAKKKKTDAVNV